MNIYRYIIENDIGTVEVGKSFKNLTTIGCGGLIDYYVKPSSIEKLSQLYKTIIQNNVKYFIIGNGSNVLAHDEDYKGVVISLKDMDKYYKIDNDILTVSANYPTTSLAYSLSLINKGDLSYLGGIPGTIGGAVYNNSGAYKKSISDDLISVKYINTCGEVKELDLKNLDLLYRYSVFHKIPGIIVEAKFRLIDIDTKDILLLRKKKRQETQPLNEKNMGSIFKNSNLIPSYKIIDGLNLRGFNIGDACVSTKHSNFIINKGQAKFYEMLKLIEIIQKKSYNEIGIKLEYEITIV